MREWPLIFGGLIFDILITDNVSGEIYGIRSGHLTPIVSHVYLYEHVVLEPRADNLHNVVSQFPPHRGKGEKTSNED